MLRRSSINQKQRLLHSWRNRWRSLLLLGFLAGYLLLLSWLFWGSAAAIWLTAILGMLLLFMPDSSPQLLMRLCRARPLNRWQAPELYQLVEQLALRAELATVPQLYLLPMRQSNAMAVGSSDKSAIAISEGLLRFLDRRELAGVLAHEISHLRNGDIRVMQLAELASRVTNSLSLFGLALLLLNLPLVLFSDYGVNWTLFLLLLFAPQLNALAQLGLSRVREYSADLGAATLTGDPQGLASALQKIERQSNGIWGRLLPGYTVPHWLRTHPPTRERIRRLLELSLSQRTASVWQVAPERRPQTILQPVKIVSVSPYYGRQSRAVGCSRRWYD